VPARRVLILGGTREARELAARLVELGHEVTTSLAGVTSDPELPRGEVRRGGFGGAAGLADYLRDREVDALIDATHPFAAQVSAHAAEAVKMGRVPMIRLERPAWRPEPGDEWIDVADAEAAVLALPSGARVLLTIGRKGIAPFLMRRDLSGIVRAIEPPAVKLDDGWELHLARPPFTLEAERALMARASVTHLVTKNAGGELTRAKLVAARTLKIPVVMIARPRKPDVVTISKPEGVLSWLTQSLKIVVT
jgi:precorrin-6A/cobalt-precorrin-6A reductase